jgi:hypothetical protein
MPQAHAVVSTRSNTLRTSATRVPSPAPEDAAGTLSTLVREAQLSPKAIESFERELAELGERFGADYGSVVEVHHLMLSLHPGSGLNSGKRGIFGLPKREPAK